jgi:hypothetical protein
MTKLPKSLEDKMEMQAAIPNEKLINRLEEVIWKDGVHFGALEVKALADRKLVSALEGLTNAAIAGLKPLPSQVDAAFAALAEWTALWGDDESKVQR